MTVMSLLNLHGGCFVPPIATGRDEITVMISVSISNEQLEIEIISFTYLLDVYYIFCGIYVYRKTKYALYNWLFHLCLVFLYQKKTIQTLTIMKKIFSFDKQNEQNILVLARILKEIVEDAFRRCKGNPEVIFTVP